MCGIAGFFSAEHLFNKTDLEAMTRVLSHRGPDAEGYFQDEIASLGHKRLSIIDLSALANQPMHSHNERYVMAYNGEVYNYENIASQLNLDWKTHSDTEVVLEAFSEWGESFVNKLNGMYAMAIYDKLEHSLYIFRDRVGIKPLYYYWDGSNFAFASELKSILQINHLSSSKSLNKKGIQSFLHLGYIPEPDTIYNEINKFPSGHFAKITLDNLTFTSYWTPEQQIAEETISDPRIAKNTLKNLIEDSVSARLMSDVPFGVLLSGGIDSSLIAAVAQSNSSDSINTFSIGFKESKFNEAPYAHAISKHLNTKHHELILSDQDAIPLVEQMTEVYGEPFADSSAIPTLLVSKLASKDVTMTLSGDGGDELFYGYGSYTWAERLSTPMAQIFKKPIELTLDQLSSKYQRAAQYFNYSAGDDIRSHIFSQEQGFFAKRELSLVLADQDNDVDNLVKVEQEVKRTLSAAESQALFDFKYYLKDCLLVKLDRASMTHSLEARVPLLDHNIVEFASNLAPELKQNGQGQKLILKEVLYDYIPASYFNRPKWGFDIPLIKWLKNELAYLIEDHLSKRQIETYGILHYPYVEQIKIEFLSGKDYLFNRLWCMIVLQKWLKNMHS